jgi:hypothetical protein
MKYGENPFTAKWPIIESLVNMYELIYIDMQAVNDLIHELKLDEMKK